ncbi:MAG: glycosyltransferase family 4 protein [Thaumarchaeota archaeon]|nr:glycosyltransferase family 4 protein [Nitrososphaerota archaeon]
MTCDPPVGSGGMEGRALAYTRALVRSGVHVEVAALAPHQEMSVEPYQGTTLTRLSSSILQLPRTFGALVRMISRSSLDSIFILSGGSTAAGLLVLGFSRLTGRKSGIFFYGRDILQARQQTSGRISLMLSILLAGRVATNSRYTAGLLPLGPRSPLAIIYPGVDARIAEGPSFDQSHQQSRRILFVGRLVRRKGGDLLLTAFSLLRPTFADLRLDIVGDGPEMGNLRTQADELGLGDAVTFHGALYGRSLWARYAEASIFVMPSRQSKVDAEGFGTVFLEAGAFGVPSVGTRTGGIPEAVIDGVTGTLVRSEDVEGLRAAIQGLLADPSEMGRMGKNARQRASGLSWEASTTEVLCLFESDVA